MKQFTIYSNDAKTRFRIVFQYRNPFDKKPTKRESVYHSEAEAKRAAKGFLNRGYKLVNSL